MMPRGKKLAYAEKELRGSVDQFPAYVQRRLQSLGNKWEPVLWDAVCNTFLEGRFYRRDFNLIVKQLMEVNYKSAQEYANALLTYWLYPGNSDLYKFGYGLYGWKEDHDYNVQLHEED